MDKKTRFLVLFFLFCSANFWSGLLYAEMANRFVFGILAWTNERYNWDPYPNSVYDILSFLTRTSSVQSVDSPRTVTLNDGNLFETPFLLISGASLWQPTVEEKEHLKRYLARGGFLWIDDRSDTSPSLFDESVRRVIKEIFPANDFYILPTEHAVYRSFYLLREYASGRRIRHPYLEGIDIGGRTAVLYSQNDILGAWAKDRLGNYLFSCDPGGEPQRWEAQKLTVNIIFYSLTGTYKTDPIHLPFIEDKLKIRR